MVTETCISRSLSDSWLRVNCGRESLQQDVHMTARTGSCGPVKTIKQKLVKVNNKLRGKSWVYQDSFTLKDHPVWCAPLIEAALPKSPQRTPPTEHQAFPYLSFWGLPYSNSQIPWLPWAVSWHNMHLVQLSKSLWSFTYLTLFKSPVCLLRFKAVS